MGWKIIIEIRYAANITVRSTQTLLKPITEPFATMIRDERYKLVVYHGHGLGELFDLEADPDEFDNLWDDPALTGTKLDLMQRSFDGLALATDTGAEQVTWF